LSGLGSTSARISVEDMAYVEDLVPPGVPEVPYNPDPPHYSEHVLGLACRPRDPEAAEADVI